jgi:hypothetical protein
LTALCTAQNVPRNGACFYRDTNYRGAFFCTQAGESLEALPAGFKDAIRSIQIFGDAQVMIYNDGRYAGPQAALRSDVPDLAMLRMPNDPGRNWAKRISSLQVSQSEGRSRDWNYTWGNGQASGNTGACFFDDTNFRGRSFCIDRGQAINNLPSGFNDRIQSIRLVGDSEVQVFNDNNFSGAAARTSRDVPDLRAWRIPDDPSKNWGDRISSLRVDSPGRGRWDNIGGYRQDVNDDRRGVDDRNLIRCSSQPGERQRYCSTPGYASEAFMINSFGTCRKNVSWGIDDGRLWVANGCSAEFQVR